MNTANPAVRVTLPLSVFYKHRLFVAWHKKSKRSSKESSGTVLALKNLRSKIQAPGRAPRRGVLRIWLFSNLTVSHRQSWGLGDVGRAGGGKGLGRDNILSSTEQWLFSGPCTTTHPGYTELPSSTLCWAGSAKERGIKVALTSFLLSVLISFPKEGKSQGCQQRRFEDVSLRPLTADM